MKKPYYKAVDGKEYPCKILRRYGRMVDLQLQAKNDDTYFVAVPLTESKYSYKPSARVVFK